MNNKNCLVCSSINISPVFNLKDLPLYNLHYFHKRIDALNADKADIFFMQCQDCGFLFNNNYKQLNYKIEYDATRTNSETFKRYLHYVSENLVKNLEKDIKKVVEVGAGDGYFSELLNDKMTDVSFSCYDPSWKVSEKKGSINRIASLYNDQNEYPDLVIARHVLEHQSDVLKFIEIISRENPKYIFIEIPCSSYVFKNNYHYFSYEHCSYFDILSLNILMKEIGYSSQFEEYVFNNENIIALYKKKLDHEIINIDKKKLHQKMIKNYKKEFLFNNFLNWRDNLIDKIQINDFIWGAAGKGVMMMNILNLDYKKIPFIVDINPSITGNFFPITGNEIIHPSQLKNLMTKGSKIIAMNKLYLKEINNELSGLGISNKVVYIGDL